MKQVGVQTNPSAGVGGQVGAATPPIPIPPSNLPAIVTGGSQPGTYTQRGTANGKPYYNLEGHDDNPDSWALSWNPATSPAVEGWTIVSSGGDPAYTSAYKTYTLGLATTIVNLDEAVIRFSGNDFAIGFRVATAFAASFADGAGGIADPIVVIGISDSPTRTQMATKIAALMPDLVSIWPSISATAVGETVVFRERLSTWFAITLHANTSDFTLTNIVQVPDTVAFPWLVNPLTWWGTEEDEEAVITVTQG